MPWSSRPTSASATTGRCRAPTSYSRLEGNYEGVSSNDTTVGQLDPNLNATYDLPDFLVNGYGLLPLDRTHQLKAYGSYVFDNIPLELSANFSLPERHAHQQADPVAWYGGAAGFAQDPRQRTAGRPPPGRSTSAPQYQLQAL